MPSYNLIILGGRGTGKATLLKRLLTEEFEWTDNLPRLDFFTSHGGIQFNCMDIRAEDRPYALVGSDLMACAIIMFDVTDWSSFRLVAEWIHAGPHINQRTPIVLCGNKVDDAINRQVTAEQVAFAAGGNLQYYEISARKNDNVEMPFLYLARRLTQVPNLHFVEFPAPAPPEVQIDMAIQQHEAELAAAAMERLPDDDDDAYE